jgi:hypothetical protein
MKFSRTSLAAFLSAALFCAIPLTHAQSSGGGASAGASSAGAGSSTGAGVGVGTTGVGAGATGGQATTPANQGVAGAVIGNGGVAATGPFAVQGANGTGGIGGAGRPNAGAGSLSSRGTTGANTPGGFTGTRPPTGTSVAGSNVAGQTGFSVSGQQFDNRGFPIDNQNQNSNGFNQTNQNGFDQGTQGGVDQDATNSSQTFGDETRQSGFSQNGAAQQFDSGEFGSVATGFNGRNPFSNDFRMGNPGTSTDTDGQGGGADSELGSGVTQNTTRNEDGQGGFDYSDSGSTAPGARQPGFTQPGFTQPGTGSTFSPRGLDSSASLPGFGNANARGVAGFNNSNAQQNGVVNGQSRFATGQGGVQQPGATQTPSQAAVTRAAQRRDAVLQRAGANGSAVGNGQTMGNGQTSGRSIPANSRATGTSGQSNPFRNFDPPSETGSEFQPRSTDTFGYERL